jgi:hypothetical protein
METPTPDRIDTARLESFSIADASNGTAGELN